MQNSDSWLQVTNALGLSVGGAGKIAVVRRAAELDLDVSHLSPTPVPSPRKEALSTVEVDLGPMGLTDLAAECSSWTEFRDALGLKGGSGYETAKVLASRNAVDTSHFRARTDPLPLSRPDEVRLDFGESVGTEHLRFAATGIATAWFMRRGYMVSVPVEPTKYDLVVESGTGLKKVQIKSTNHKGRNGHWVAHIGHQPYDADSHMKRRKSPYSAEDVDYFFIVCGDDSAYLVPIGVTEGATNIVLGVKYREFLAPL